MATTYLREKEQRAKEYMKLVENQVFTTRTEMFNYLNKILPVAIINKREAFIRINEEAYFIITKRVENGIIIKKIW